MVKDELTTTKRERRTLQYVSRHFHGVQEPSQSSNEKSVKSRKRRKVVEEKENGEFNVSISVDETSEVKAETVKLTRRVAAQRKKTDARTRDSKKVKLEQSPNRNVRDGKDGSGPKIDPREDLDIDSSAIDAGKNPPSRTSTHPHIIAGVDISQFSSDSELSDPPSDLGPDPYTRTAILEASASHALLQSTDPKSKSKSKKKKAKTKTSKTKPKLNAITKSPYFPHAHKQRPTFLSTLPFPPLSQPHFGLMQEKLCHDPYRLLLGTIFLNKTPGWRAMPIMYDLLDLFPTPRDLANADQEDVVEVIRSLGFQNQRAAKCIAFSRVWVDQPPERGKRYRKVDYPKKKDGRDVKVGEVLEDELNSDTRVAWEISHLPGLGAYAHDSWRMFCRDELRGLAESYNGENARTSQAGETNAEADEQDQQISDVSFEPEWKRVLPLDKELRAWLTWQWMKEGWVWDKETGHRTKASDELMALARGEGNVVLESDEGILHVESTNIVEKSGGDVSGTAIAEGEIVNANGRVGLGVGVPAGDFLPDHDEQTAV